jgi:paraquat-inducible protein B
MSKQANPTIIGVFVLGAVLIAILGITVFTSGKWFSEKSEFVIYFNESVNGLNVGALMISAMLFCTCTLLEAIAGNSA